MKNGSNFVALPECMCLLPRLYCLLKALYWYGQFMNK